MTEGLHRVRPSELRFALERGRVPRPSRIEAAHGVHEDEAWELDVERFALEARLRWAGPGARPSPRLLWLRREYARRSRP